MSSSSTALSFDPALLSRLLGVEAGAAPPQQRTEDMHAPFLLTEIQRGYLLGRDPSLPLGGAACQFYYELDCETLDIARYRAAWGIVMARHPMLRARILDATRQEIAETIPALEIVVRDLSDDAARDATIDAIRRRLSRALPAENRWPMIDVELSLLPAGRVRVHLRFDLLIADQQSILILLDEVARFYRDPDLHLPTPDITFRDCVLSELDEADLTRARRYWRERAESLPDAPALPVIAPPNEAGTPVYDRLSHTVDKTRWDRLKATAATLGVTPSTALLSLFAEALCAFAADPHFCLNMTLFNRPPIHPDVDRVVCDFTTNMLFEADLRQAETRCARFTRLQALLWRDMEHSLVSGTAVTREMALARGHLDRPLMPVVFTSTLTQNDTRLYSDAAAQPGRPVLALSQTPQVMLDNQVMEWSGALTINWDIAVNVLDIAVARPLFDRFVTLVEAVADDPAMLEETVGGRADPTDALIAPAIVPEAERRERLADLWLRALPGAMERPAIATSGAVLTHGALARQVAGIANALVVAGVRRGETVAIRLEKSPEQIAACLAVALVGGVYVPLDTAQPLARQARILEDLTPAAMLERGATPDALATGAPAATIDLSRLGEGDPALLHHLAGAQPDDPAYIIYTSGSTGNPKGVTVTHAAAVNTIADVSRRFGIGGADCVLGLSQLHFDLSVYDIFGVLGAGGTLVLPDPAEQQNPAHWHALATRHGVTLWNSVPGLFSLYVDYHEVAGIAPPPALKTVMLSGDWIGLDLPGRARRLWPDAAQYSLGGATEAAIWSIFHAIDEVDPAWTSIPYGRALGRQQVFVLDDALAIAPIGHTGDLYIAGDGLALGYLNDAEKTAAHFFPHPRTGLALYRTGDLGAYGPDGAIIFQGRADAQVKINGFRVEPGEVARALQRHADVEEAQVLAVGDPRRPRLVAFFRPARAKVEETGLAAHLAEELPAYMVPAAFKAVDAWPLTPNGKLDRKALLALVAQEPEAAPSRHPSSSGEGVERAVLEMVAAILQRPAVSLDDNLVHLGASSLELIALANHIEAFAGARPPLTDLARAVRLPDLVALVQALAPQGAAQPAELVAGAAALRAHLSRNPVLTDPVARRLFKSRPRPVAAAEAPVLLSGAAEPPAAAARRSWRDFIDRPLTTDELSTLLAPLRRHYRDGEERRLYASAGGLYPVETYLAVPPGGIEDLAPGGYRYDPQAHALSPCTAPDGFADLALLSSGSRETLAASRLVLCFVLSLDAIAPLYDAASLGFGLIECGAMCQALEQQAVGRPFGLCQIGDLPLDEMGRRFALSPDHVCLHAMAAGALEPQARERWLSATTAYAQDMTEGTL
ncbi:amino acid adenylation domain-containing protein (plasmid) [Shinella yambaruensis]|uniref:non-ribosomal peptide synthetase n=1 Tax=Shinella yambaruensis TaxID=415996 RepID=UPI003D7A4972